MAPPLIKISMKGELTPKGFVHNLKSVDKPLRKSVHNLMEDVKKHGVKAAQKASLPKGKTGKLHASFARDSSVHEDARGKTVVSFGSNVGINAL